MRRKIFIALLLILIAAFALFYNEYNSRFTTENWINNPNLRYKMIDSIETNYQLQGKTNLEIIDILGEPDVKWEHNFEDGHYIYYQYYIGKKHNFFEIMGEPDIYLITFCEGLVVSTSVQPT